MKYCVLGPVAAVTEDGEAVALGGPKQRAVLALLLAHLGRIVSTDEFLDGIWEGSATGGSRGSLQTYISELRGVLDDPIVYERGGYRLETEATTLDAARFEKAVTAAREDLTGDPERAAEQLREALGLWHGSPYADIGGLSVLRAEISRLEQLRLGALEDRIDADLALGRHHVVADELDVLVREHPFRERLWAMRMLAQYRAGRQAHALDTYERARAILRDELGLDPGPELQELQDRILRQDPALDVAPDSDGAAASPRARSLEVRALIGEGPHGSVYRAYQASIGREVALKVISGDTANEPHFVRRFGEVTQRWALLDHPNVLSLLDAWRDPEGAHLVFPLLEDSLDRRAAGEELPAHAALRALDETAQAVSYLHRHGIAHGAVTPENVLLDEEGHVRLADAGTTTLMGHSDRDEDLSALGRLATLLLGGPDHVTARDVEEVVAAARNADYERVEDFRRELRRAVGADVVAMAMAVPSTNEVRNPFKGLRPFQESDAEDFFGREGVVDAVVERLEREPFVALVGPSGSGKSSLVRAGLLPAVRSGHASDSKSWLVADLFPGQYPFEEFLAALRSVAVHDLDVTAADLVRDERALLRAVKQALPSDDSVLLLFVDQLEEVFSVGLDSQEGEIFLAALAAAANEAGDRLRLLVTLRGDFFEHGLRHPAFAPLLTQATVPVGTPSSSELAAAIARPAHRAGLDLEPGLVDEIVADVRKQPGGLPLLQYACTQLVERREGTLLTRAAYRASGGVGGALERRAEEVFRGLSVAAAGAAEAVFLRLVTVRTDGQDVRRRVHRTELDALHDEATPVDDVVSAFGAARLVTFDRDPVTRGPTVEIAHDALLTQWPRLRQWLDSRRDDVVQRQRLQESVREWEEAGHDRGFLLPERRLTQYEDWASSVVFPLTAREHDYLAASREAAERQRAEDEARREREERLELRSTKRLRTIAVVSLVAALIAAGLSLFAFGQRNRAQEQQERAERQGRIATARELAATSVAQLMEDPERSVLLAMEAIRTTRAADGVVLPEAETALRRALQSSHLEHEMPAGGGMAVAPDGRIATLGAGGTLTIWDPQTWQPLVEVPGQVVARDLRTSVNIPTGDMDFSPDGATLVVADAEHEGHVRDATTGDVLVDLDGSVTHPVFSPGGDVIAGGLIEAADDGSTTARRIGLWDAASGEMLRVLDGPSRNVEDHAFSPDGTLLATANATDGLWLWDVTTGETLWHATTGDAAEYSVAFHPDGRRLASGTLEGPVRLHDVATGDVVDTFAGEGGGTLAVAFSADGQRVLAAGGEGSARLWNLETGEQTVVLRGQGLVDDAAFAPGGDRVVTSSQDDTTRVWNVGLRGAAGYGALKAYAGSAPVKADFAPDGHRLVMSGADGIARVWDLETMEQVLSIASERPVHLTAYSGDGTAIATAGTVNAGRPSAEHADQIDIWDAATGQHLTTLEGPGAVGWDLALNHDGSVVVHAGVDGVLRALDTSTGDERYRYVHDAGSVYRAAFTPDGSRLVVGAQDAGLLLDAVTGEVTDRFEVERSVVDVAFPEPQRMVVAELATKATLRDAATGEEIETLARVPELITVAATQDLLALGRSTAVTVRNREDGDRRFTVRQSFEVSQLLFSPDGRFLVALGHGELAYVHLVDLDDLLDLAEERVTRSLAPAECEEYLHGPCPRG